MIQISDRAIKEVCQDYFNELKPIIHARYLKYKGVDINPFTNSPVTSLFEDALGNFDDTFLCELLCGPIISNPMKYDSIHNYIRTVKIAFYGNIAVDKILAQLNCSISHKNRINLRKNFINENSNLWVMSDVNSCPGYSLSKVNMLALISKIKTKLQLLNTYIEKIINYSILPPDLRHKILTRIGVNVCPYCNRQYISMYDFKNKIYTTADLDHFYPKSMFSLLALSLYNFIPSCPICNSKLKSYKPIQILYPYAAGFKKTATFRLAPIASNIVDVFQGKSLDFDINFNIDSTNKDYLLILGNIEMFRLDLIYEVHKQYAMEVLDKKHKHSKAYRSIFNDLFQKLGLDGSDIDLFLFGYRFNEADYMQKPLTKFTYDILYNQ